MASGKRTIFTVSNRPSVFDDSDSENSNQDPYCDGDGEYGSDGNYEPENGDALSSDSDDYQIFNRPRHFTRQVTVSESEESDNELNGENDDQSEGNIDTQILERLEAVEPEADEYHRTSPVLNFPANLVDQFFDDPLPDSQDIPTRQDSETRPYDDGESEAIPSDAENESVSNQEQNRSLSPHLNVTQVRNTTRSRTPPPVSGEWEDIVTDIPDFRFDAASSGPRVHVDQNMTAEEVFDLLFPANIIEYLVECTNAYGKSLTNQNRPHTRNSRNKVFHETNNAEMKKFLGLTLLQGQIKIPDRRKLFTHTDILYYHPIFSYSMSSRRYEQILRCICCSELNSRGSDKVNTFINMLTQNFRNVYQPKKELSLDESLMLYRGRLIFRTYMKNKKTKYGIKFYVLTTDDGYVLNILMYSGNEGLNNDDDASPKVQKLVLRLMRPYLLKGHELYMDNFYNSVPLSEKLLDLKTHTNGTLRANRRGNPSVLAQAKLKKGEHRWLRKGKVYVSHWRDKRQVLMITTLDHPEIIEVMNKRGQKLMKPKEVVRYNGHMSGIDRADQMVSYYSCPRKTIRWYKKVLFHMMDLATWNAYYIFHNFVENTNKKSLEYIEYRDKLIKSLLKVDENKVGRDLVLEPKSNWNRKIAQVAQPQPPEPEAAAASGIGHWPMRIESKNPTKKKFDFKACRVCQKKKIRRETSYRCKGCPNSPPLCPTCFEEWHQESEV